jgi:hypothetical protein
MHLLLMVEVALAAEEVVVLSEEQEVEGEEVVELPPMAKDLLILINKSAVKSSL